MFQNSQRILKLQLWLSHVRDKYPKTRRAFQPSKQSFILGGRTNVITYKYKLRVVKDKLFSVFIHTYTH